MLDRAKSCGADRDRTDDLRLAKPALSQLSYSPVVSRLQRLRVGQGRLELPTSRLSGVRSNHLSYWPGQVTFGGVAPFGSPRSRLLGQKAEPHGVAGSCCSRGCRPTYGPRSLETEPYAHSTVGLDLVVPVLCAT